MKTLTKVAMVEHLMDTMALPRQDARLLVDGFFDMIIEQLGEGREVKLSGFGNFRLRDKRSRPARNPRTGEAAMVSARRVVSFRAGQKLRKRLQERK